MSTRFNYTDHLDKIVPLLLELENLSKVSAKKLAQLTKKYALKNGKLLSKTHLIEAYKQLAGRHGLAPYNRDFITKIMMKPVRTVSGVAPVTVLTKPFPCPGKCIFCPSDVRMPKSYLSDEPGAQRAERNLFDPYLQTYNRLKALSDMGHSVDKVELIILGGTWSFYPETYQIWFIKECFRALNDFPKKDDREKINQNYQKKIDQLKKNKQVILTSDPVENKKSFDQYQIEGKKIDQRYNEIISDLYVAPEKRLGLDKQQVATWEELEIEQKKNELAKVRNVGLVIETRPDNISEKEVLRIRRLGCTKTQIGVQSLQDQVLTKNKRGHDIAATRRAFSLLRQAGFKIHAHWMANLYGSNVEKDIQDYELLFSDPDFKPDELKIYPCSLIGSAELMQYYQAEKWRPYTHQELLKVLSFVLLNTPPFCRLTRVIRDIPSPDIVVGNKKTNFRQIAQQHLEKLGQKSKDIRAREIRGQDFNAKNVFFDIIKYQTTTSEEQFLQFLVKTKDGEKLLAFLRLSLPKKDSFIDELKDSAMIREIHVYGRLQSLGKKTDKHAQHGGLGTKLIEKAKKIVLKKDYRKLAVISAVGTRDYYRKKGFEDGELYQFMELATGNL